MKRVFKSLLFTSLCAIPLIAAAPQFPFPQNKAYPYGHTFKSADTDKIKKQFLTWKGAWYTEQGTYYQKYEGGSDDANKTMPNGTARIISPNAKSELTVSEGIAYGMLIFVYMSDAQNNYQTEFDKLFRYWKCYGKGLNGNGCDSWSGQGMDWQIDNFTGSVSSGTASDGDFDAALALIMAYKQWGEDSYLDAAKKLITWIKANDMESDGSIRPGSNWNEAFNPSYSNIAAFQLFYEVTNDTFWQTAINTTLTHLRACQNAKTGLMPDWCDWNTHQVTETSASVSGGYLGFYDDAARTPWRMTQGYQWYGIEKAKEVNEAINPWLNLHSYGYAGMIYPGYKLDGTVTSDPFVSSTFAGGLGLSMAVTENPGSYLENLYYTLINTEGKVKLTAQKGENYFAATLNVLYLLTLTGNMPNFYNMTGYTDFTANPEDVLKPTAPEGVLQDTSAHATVSGYEFWGAYADKFGVTQMYPDSGNTAIYLQEDGSYIISTEAFLAAEPIYEPAVELQYPFSGVACSFAKDQGYFNLSDLTTVRITYKSQGLIRFALLDEETLVQDQEGGEPGFYLQPTTEWTTIDIDITSDAYDKFNSLNYPNWVNFESTRTDVLRAVRGVKFDTKMAKSGYSSFDLKELLLLDANGNTIEAMKETQSIAKNPLLVKQNNLFIQGKNIVLNGFKANSRIQVFDLNGVQVKSMQTKGESLISIETLAKNKGTYLFRISDNNKTQSIRFVR